MLCLRLRLSRLFCHAFTVQDALELIDLLDIGALEDWELEEREDVNPTLARLLGNPEFRQHFRSYRLLIDMGVSKREAEQRLYNSWA